MGERIYLSYSRKLISNYLPIVINHFLGDRFLVAIKNDYQIVEYQQVTINESVRLGIAYLKSDTPCSKYETFKLKTIKLMGIVIDIRNHNR